MHNFTFDGISSSAFDMAVFFKAVNDGSARQYTSLQIPGRMGTVLIDGKSHANVVHSYTGIIYEDAEDKVDDLRSFLLSKTGYKRLEDSYHPGEFYQAAYLDDFTATFSQDRIMAKIDIGFSRKPQRWLKTGEQEIIFDQTGTITNPTRYDARPLLRVWGTGTVKVGATTFTISGNASTYLDIDCDVMEAYRGAVSYNGRVSLDTLDYPVIHEGDSQIVLGGDVTRVRVTPRWYIL